jgi:hypothetical protein
VYRITFSGEETECGDLRSSEWRCRTRKVEKPLYLNP